MTNGRTPALDAPAARSSRTARAAPGGARPGGLVAAVALAAAAAGGVAWIAPASAAPFLAAASALAGGALAARLRRAAPARPEEAFAALFRDAPYGAALSDLNCVVTAANSRLGLGHALPDGALVTEALALSAPAPGALAYRLAGAAARYGAASEDATLKDRTARVAARRVGRDRLLWAVDRTPPAARAAAASNALIEGLPVAVARLSADGDIVFANAAARALLGSAAQPGARIGALVEGLGRSMETRVAEALRGDSSGRPEIARSEPDGREVFLQVSLTRLEIEGESSLVAVFADATELKTLEAQFVQSQKMQAVGQLAGGVAHDFNNLLTAIAGHTDLLLHRHDQGDADYADLTQIRQNANRAAALVRQLLAFSRKQTLRPKVVNLVDTLGEISHLLNRLLGEKFVLRIAHAADAHFVKVDERQFEQVVMNLVVNARDAMAGGGIVSISTQNVRVEAETRRGRAVMPRGDYVRIDVADTGTGIAPDKIDQIFEPFYTTKRQGEGTGLGLSTVYGIVKQTGGFIFVDSAPGRGATFSIYLPRHAPTAEELAPKPKAPVATDLTGAGVVLLIEDEAPVRAFAARALRLRGYEVFEAASAEEALTMLDAPDFKVDVLVSDVVMPGMDGPTCVREARKKRPGVRVVFVSGYAEDALKRGMGGLEDCHFLPKPFSLNELTAKIKECAAG
jgi:two-component system cell cycle sensor histidine kinase/response regulator CckA